MAALTRMSLRHSRARFEPVRAAGAWRREGGRRQPAGPVVLVGARATHPPGLLTQDPQHLAQLFSLDYWELAEKTPDLSFSRQAGGSRLGGVIPVWTLREFDPQIAIFSSLRPSHRRATKRNRSSAIELVGKTAVTLA